MDAHRTVASFVVSDCFLLSTNWALASKFAQPKNVLSQKLMPNWMGRSTITEKVNEVAYPFGVAGLYKVASSVPRSSALGVL